MAIRQLLLCLRHVIALLAAGKSRESISEFEAALRLKPDLKVAADNLRRAQAQLNSQK